MSSARLRSAHVRCRRMRRQPRHRRRDAPRAGARRCRPQTSVNSHSSANSTRRQHPDATRALHRRARASQRRRCIASCRRPPCGDAARQPSHRSRPRDLPRSTPAASRCARAPARTSHQSMRGRGDAAACPARAGTSENVRVTFTRGRPLSKVSSVCAGSANTCTPSTAGSCSSGICAAVAPSAVASTTTRRRPRPRAAPAACDGSAAAGRCSGSHGCGAFAGTGRTCSTRGAAGRRQRAAGRRRTARRRSRPRRVPRSAPGDRQCAAAFGDQQEAALDHGVAAAADLARDTAASSPTRCSDAPSRRVLVELPGHQRRRRSTAAPPSPTACCTYGIVRRRLRLSMNTIVAGARRCARRRASTASDSGCGALVADAQRRDRQHAVAARLQRHRVQRARRCCGR